MTTEAKSIKVGSRTYTLGGILGVGGFSEVRRGTCQNTNRKVALKLMFIDGMGSPNEVQSQLRQVQKEIKAMKQLSNPNIVRLLGYDLKSKLDNRQTIVMVQELAPRGELFDYLMYTKNFPQEMTISLFKQLINGLKACHSQGIAHRDLKPENLLFDADYNLKIADFGFSYIFRKGEGQKNKMKTELGTRGYMAPEILSNVKYDEKTDIFAAGVILFICLAGFPPFQNAVQSDWWFDKLQKHKYRLFWMAHERTATFTTEAKELIQNMLEPDPSARFDVNGVMQSSFYNAKCLNKNELKANLQDRNRKVQQEKINAKTGVTRDTMMKNLCAYNETLPGTMWFKDIIRNATRENLALVQTEAQLMEQLNVIAKGSNRLQGLFAEEESKLKKTPKEVAEGLVAAETDKDVLALLNVNQKDATAIFKKVTASDLAGDMPQYNPGLFKQLIELDSLQPEAYDTYVHNNTAVRVNLGFGTLVYGLKLFCEGYSSNPEAKVDPRGEFEVDPDECSCDMKFVIKHELQLPLEENPNELATAVLEYNLDIRANLYSDPHSKGNNIIVFNNMANKALTRENFDKIVKKIVGGTDFFLATAISDDQSFEQYTGITFTEVEEEKQD